MSIQVNVEKQINQLLSMEAPYSLYSKQDSETFENTLIMLHQFYREENAAFQQLNISFGDPIPVSLYKEIDFNQPDENTEGFWFASSGTSGRASKVFYDKQTLQRIFTAQLSMFKHYNFISDTPTRYMIFAPNPHSENAPSYSFTFTKMAECAPVKELIYVVKPDNSLDIELISKSVKEWERDDKPIYMFGLTVFIEQFMLNNSHQSCFSGKVKVITGGGWKGMTQTLGRPEIVHRLKQLFSKAEIQVHDIYGLTEHPLHYLSCKHQHFHIPKYSRFQIISALGHECSEGEKGLIRLQNPLSSLFPNYDLLTEDIGIKVTDCQCGCELPAFRFINRQANLAGTCAYESKSSTN